MAEPVVSFLVESIAKLLMEEGKFLSGVSDEAGQLHSELKMMRALLKDADEKQHEASVVKEWVSQSKDVAYEAENVLEDYAFKLASKSSKKGVREVLKRYACILNECCIRHKVGLEIQSLNTRISNLTKRFQEYGIRAVTERELGSSSSQRQLRMTYSCVGDNEDFVGFGHDVEKLVEELVRQDDFYGQYGVVSITGMGGSGKTTLARKVYNHPDVKSHFDIFAWFCISQQWQPRNILQGILVSFAPEKRQEIEKWRDDEIVRELLHVQQNRRCLVVLDDIWSTDAWECIRVAFPIRKEGNKILLTTRNKDVAIHIGPHGYHHEPRSLSDDEGWELLQKKALKHGSGSGYSDLHKLEELGKQMVKFCVGLPLAVVVLGGILATKESFNEWNLVYQNIKSYLGKGESIEQHEGEVRNILALSYNDLPYKLKPCFLYLGGFPEDEDITVGDLYNLWIGEGMVFAEDRIGEETMMDVAERYLEVLVKRCIVHVWTAPYNRKYISCQLHDLMRDLCLAKAAEENFLKLIDYGQGNGMVLANSTTPTISTGNYIHRIMIYLSEKKASKYVPLDAEATNYKHLRTIVFCSRPRDGNLMAQLAESQFNKFKMLRSLTIEGVTSPGLEKIRNSSSGGTDDVFKLPIDGLIHLRCLSLRYSRLAISPMAINKLEHLETLDLSYTMILWTTNSPLRMRRLQRLYLWDIKNFYDNIVVKMLIHIPNTLEILEGLDTLTFDVRYSSSECSNLRDLNASLTGEAKDSEEFIKYVSTSNKLRHAIIRNEFSDNWDPLEEAAFLEQLFSSSNLHCLLLTRMRKLPEYKSQILRNLLELRLVDFSLEEDSVEMLEKLPNLQTLVFSRITFKGKEMVFHSGGFPELRFLQLDFLFNLEKWTVEEGAMPKLYHLEMSGCRGLTMVPEGLWAIPALKQLVIHGAMNEEFMSDYQEKSKLRE